MKILSKDFEGSFVIFENISWGFKWKTGFHDEQPRIEYTENIKFKKKESFDLYDKLVEIFKNKAKKEIKTEKLQKNTDEKQNLAKILSTDIITAFKREQSKNEPISNTPKDKRDELTIFFTKLVIDEVTNKYKESSLSPPYSNEQLIKQSNIIVASLIKKEP
jgi:hypothetical protein